jgi:hypothetical protein
MAQLAEILRLDLPRREIRRDQFDASLCKSRVERIAVVSAVADRVFNELRFMSRTTCNPAGDRKTQSGLPLP